MKAFFLLLGLFFTHLSLQAQVQDKWKINVGAMFVTNFETEMQLTPKNLPLGVRINTKDQLGMKNETGVFRFDGYYRFSDIQSIDITYFSVRSKGERVINTDIQWQDNNISAGTSINSHFDIDILKINYGYSFYHNDRVELTLTAGLHITAIDVGLGASGVVDGNSTNSYSSASSATLPLPVIGFQGEYTIVIKKLFVNYRTDYFYLNFDNFKGTLISSSLSFEYRFEEHIGVGLGYNSNQIYLKTDNGDNQLEITNNLTGALLYFTYTY